MMDEDLYKKVNTDLQNRFYISLLAVTTIVFFTLRVTDTVKWAWIWVFAPVWIPLAISVSSWAITTTLGFFIFVIKHFVARAEFNRRMNMVREMRKKK